MNLYVYTYIDARLLWLHQVNGGQWCWISDFRMVEPRPEQEVQQLAHRFGGTVWRGCEDPVQPDVPLPFEMTGERSLRVLVAFATPVWSDWHYRARKRLSAATGINLADIRPPDLSGWGPATGLTVRASWKEKHMMWSLVWGQDRRERLDWVLNRKETIGEVGQEIRLSYLPRPWRRMLLAYWTRKVMGLPVVMEALVRQHLGVTDGRHLKIPLPMIWTEPGADRGTP